MRGFFFKLENLRALAIRIKDSPESVRVFPQSRSLSAAVLRAFKHPPK
jgi:hypothetical protein